MWVPLVENNEHNNPGADYFIKKNIDNILRSADEIDTLLLACTHYPLLKEKILKYLRPGLRLVSQGEIVAASLENYLERHPEMQIRLSNEGHRHFFTTDSSLDFDNHASIFFGESLKSEHVSL
jgi:glutamate racemase